MGDEKGQEIGVQIPLGTTDPGQDEEARHSQEPKPPTGLAPTEENRTLIQKLIDGVRKL